MPRKKNEPTDNSVEVVSKTDGGQTLKCPMSDDVKSKMLLAYSMMRDCMPYFQNAGMVLQGIIFGVPISLPNQPDDVVGTLSLLHPYCDEEWVKEFSASFHANGTKFLEQSRDVARVYEFDRIMKELANALGGPPNKPGGPATDPAEPKAKKETIH